MFRRFRRDSSGGKHRQGATQPTPDDERYQESDAELAAEDYAGGAGSTGYGAGPVAYPAADDDAAQYAEADYAEPEDEADEYAAAEDYAAEDYDEAEDYAAGDYAAGDYADGAPAIDAVPRTAGASSSTSVAGGEPEASRPERVDLGDPATWTRLRDTQPAAAAVAPTDGPWDSGSDYPDRPRIDFGSLLVPVQDGYDIQVMMSEEEGIGIAVVHGDSGLQLQPFAAPRTSGLWHEVLPEIAQEVAKAGGQSAQQDGPFGPELLARVVPQGANPRTVPAQPLRFIGIDGPRWFLRGMISGPAAIDDEMAQRFREILADVVVVRGEHAQPPRQPLPIQLPEEARQALEDEGDGQPDPFSPFERGPEITETR